MNSGLTSGPHGGGDDTPDREKNVLYVSLFLFKSFPLLYLKSYIYSYYQIYLKKALRENSLTEFNDQVRKNSFSFFITMAEFRL